MPLLDQLSIEIEKKLYKNSIIKDEYKFIYEKYVKNKGFSNFEDILTYLYQNFPWKNTEEYFLLKSLFFYITNLLVDIFLEKEETFKEKLNKKEENKYELQLMENLINYFNYTNASIITFNYDTILEYLSLNIFGINSPIKIYGNVWDVIDIKRFCIIEVKLGNNPELRGDVITQIKGYISRISENFKDYKKCYELNLVRQQ